MKRRKPRKQPIKWHELLTHPRDRSAQSPKIFESPEHRDWANRISGPHRVYDAFNKDTGYDHNAPGPERPHIAYDAIAGCWSGASADTPAPVRDGLVKVTRVVTQDTRRLIKRHQRGYL